MKSISSLKRSMAFVLTLVLLALSQNLQSQVYTFDNSFNDDGKLFFGNQDGKELFTDMALQPDGKIVLIGRTDYDPDEGGNKRGFVLRLKKNGTLDSLFGDNGVVYIDSPDNSDEVNALEIQSDGKILIAGATELNNNGTYVYSTVTRLEQNGAVDASFGNNGVSLINNATPSLLYDIEIDTDGKIIGSGFAAPPNVGKRPFVTRLNINGSLDTSFANVGYLILNNFGDFETAGDGVAIQADHKIVLLSSKFISLSYINSDVIRLKSNGSLDSGFGPTGNGFVDVGQSGLIDAPTQIAIDNLGNIVISGTASDNSFSGTSTLCFVRRIKPNGNFDLSFDGDGKATYDPYPSVNNPDAAYGMKVLTDGSVFLAGMIATKEVAVIKFKQNGSLDLAFDGDGIWKSTIGVSGAAGEILCDSNCIYIAGITQLSLQSPNDDDAFCAKICTNTVSASNPMEKDNIAMFPNPTTGIISLTEEVAEILVYDLFGNQVASKSKSNTINLNSLENGVYLVSIADKNHIIKSQKIILIK